MDLYPICVFITETWFNICFSHDSFNAQNYKSLRKSTLPLKKSQPSFLKHWVEEDSAIPNIQRAIYAQKYL